MADPASALPCPECQFRNPPDAVRCAYCQCELPFAQETRRVSRNVARRALAAARAARALQGAGVADELELPAPSSSLDPVAADGVIAWLSCPPLPPLPLGPRPRVSIGRGAECDVVLPHSEVSRAHAVLKVHRGAITLTDEGSSNGTYLGDQRVASAQVRAGDRLRIGPYVLDVLSEQEASARSEHAKGAQGKVLEGDLREVSAAELLQAVEFNEWTGVLQVVDRKGRRGELSFVSGKLVRAEFAGRQGAEAVVGLVLLEAGRFTFSRRPMSGGGEPLPLTRILLDASRVRDEGELPSWVREGEDLDSGTFASLLAEAPTAEPAPSREASSTRSAPGTDAEAKAPATAPGEPEGPWPPTSSTATAATQGPPSDEAPASGLCAAPTAPRPRTGARRGPRIAFLLLAPLLLVVPLATWSFHRDLLQKSRAARLAWLERELADALASPRPVAEDAPALRAWRERLESLAAEDPALDVERARRRLLLLEGLCALARGDRAGAEAVLRRPEVRGHPPSRAALRGGLAATRPEGPAPGAFDDLSLALERGVRRRELRLWRARSCALEDEEQARVALADLGELQATGGSLAPREQALRVRALLAVGYAAAAADALARASEPPSALRWEVACALAAEDIDAGKAPREACVRFAGLAGAPPPAAAPLRARAREALRAAGDEGTGPVELRCARRLEWMLLLARLGEAPSAAQRARLLEDLRAPRTSLAILGRAAELFAHEDLAVRRALVEVFYEHLEARRGPGRQRYPLLTLACALLAAREGRLADVPELARSLDASLRANLYRARAAARERRDRPAEALRDLIRAKRLAPNLDLTADLARLRAQVRAQ
ncbi:MAG: FHA domain-containing protein, partial [Planctomycetota bacterium]